MRDETSSSVPSAGPRRWLADAQTALRAARRRRRERAELRQLNAGERDRILVDLGQAPGDIDFVSRAQPCTDELLAGMLARLDIAPSVCEQGRLVLRDLQRTCAECPDWRRCRYWQAGEIKDDPRNFCGNMPTFDALRGEPARPHA